MFPFSTRVAENFAKKTGRKAPKVESLGTGGGIKLFCSGSGAGFPDIANASRPMKRSEFDLCQQKGVKDIVQIKIGFDGIVIAVDKDGSDYAFKTQHLFLGLSANVLRGGQFVKNPYNSWDDVGAGLPGNRILVYGPPPSSGTRDAFVELGIEAGARQFPTLDAIRSDNEKLLWIPFAIFSINFLILLEILYKVKREKSSISKKNRNLLIFQIAFNFLFALFVLSYFW